MERYDWEELALDFVVGRLDAEGRSVVYQLIMEEPEFAKLLAYEWQLKARFDAFQPKLDSAVQEQILEKIERGADRAGLRFLHALCRTVLPPVAQPVVHFIEKGVLTYV
ncbi:MAG: hypothetical protein GX205_03250 [Firmicutes bacterium]|jgi:anti-sigma-K factor RskA|nr:hypothetical protein [Bacillota bacterium]